MWVLVPTPPEENVILPGLALARAITSATDFSGCEVAVIRISG